MPGEHQGHVRADGQAGRWRVAVVARGGRAELRRLQGTDAQRSRGKEKRHLHQASLKDRRSLPARIKALLRVLLLPHEDQDSEQDVEHEGSYQAHKPIH